MSARTLAEALLRDLTSVAGRRVSGLDFDGVASLVWVEFPAMRVSVGVFDQPDGPHAMVICTLLGGSRPEAGPDGRVGPPGEARGQLAAVELAIHDLGIAYADDAKYVYSEGGPA